MFGGALWIILCVVNTAASSPVAGMDAFSTSQVEPIRGRNLGGVPKEKPNMHQRGKSSLLPKVFARLSPNITSFIFIFTFSSAVREVKERLWPSNAGLVLTSAARIQKARCKDRIYTHHVTWVGIPRPLLLYDNGSCFAQQNRCQLHQLLVRTKVKLTISPLDVDLGLRSRLLLTCKPSCFMNNTEELTIYMRSWLSSCWKVGWKFLFRSFLWHTVFTRSHKSESWKYHISLRHGTSSSQSPVSFSFTQVKRARPSWYQAPTL